MDLRKKPSWVQRYGELIIRFRLPLIVLLFLAWWFLAASWQQTLSMVLGQAERNGQIIQSLLVGEYGNSADWIRFGFVIVLVLVLRTWLGSVGHGLRTLLSLAVVGAGCWLLDGSNDYLPVILSVLLVILATFYIFARNVWLVSALAALLTLYCAASWIPGMVQAKALGWQIITALILADLLSYVKSMGRELKKGRHSSGAILAAITYLTKPILATTLVLIATDSLLFYLELPTLHGDKLSSSIIADLGYVVSAIVIAPIMFSFSPLRRVKTTKRNLRNNIYHP
ncbi:MAG: hypothetical protein GX801_07695 [Fibrobacter sp.]|nr:hypothetical protein [Fibrobacter sp.]